DALETSIERLRDHLRRPHARKRNHLTENAAYTVNQTDLSADSVSRVTVGGGSAVLARGSRKMRDAQIIFPDISRFRMSEAIMPRRESVIPELR
ncbi:hypothetical protein, partial [Mycobacterium ulcerans]|uniref:hypothetical protein n=1 Tax=Mycobacterium ulcerans TaxID=1809 RepID=UPI0015C549DB